MPQKKLMNLKSEWDIVDVESLSGDLTERQTNPRRHQHGPSPFSAVVIVLGLASALSTTTIVPFVESASDVVSVVHRVRKPLSIKLTRTSRKVAGVDFARGRSGESLARAFDGYFRPSTDSEAEPDESCFL